MRNCFTILMCGPAAAIALAGAAQAQTELKVTAFVPQDDALMQIIEEWSETVTDRTNGEITFAFFPSSQMGPPDRQYDLARTGVADIALFIHSFTPGRFEMTEVAYLPGLFVGLPAEEGARILYELYPEYLAEEHAGTHLLAITPTAPAFVLSREAYPDLASFRGQRVRSAGSAMSDTLSALGAVPAAVPSPEMADALHRGIVDGLGVTYQSITDWQIETIGTDVWDVPIGPVSFGLVMNQERLDSLSEEARQVIIETSGIVMSEAFGQHIDLAEEEAEAAVEGMFTVTTPDGASMAEIENALAERVETGLAALEESGQPARAFYAAIEEAVAAASE